MRSPRRLRLLSLAAVVSLVIFFFYADPFHHDFYHKTVQAMDRPRAPAQAAPPPEGMFDYKGGESAPLPVEAHILKDMQTLPADRDADGDVDEDDDKLAEALKARVQAAAKEAKEHPNVKLLKPDPPAAVVGVGNAAAGQKKEDEAAAPPPPPQAAPAADAADAPPAQEASKEPPKQQDAGEKPAAEAQAPVKELSEKERAEQEVDRILKEAPVVVFSKTYCPFSKRAKALLLDKYFLTPPPYVVELDEHDLGSAIQDVLLARTGRRTVPNVLVQGTSIGGADDVAALDANGQLIAKVESLGRTEIKITERL